MLIAVPGIRNSPDRFAAVPRAPELVRRDFDEVGVEEFSSLGAALDRFETKRSRSMDKDHFPDAKTHKYEHADVIRLPAHRIVFENGSARVEPR